MLVLTRKQRESIKIGPDIEITVLRLGSDKVSIGIAAPREIPVIRSELLERSTEYDGAESD